MSYNNVPQGFAPYISNSTSKVFIAVPRRLPGVPSTLNFVELDDDQKILINPKLQPYPSYEMNELDVSYCTTERTDRKGEEKKLINLNSPEAFSEHLKMLIQDFACSSLISL